MTVRPAGDGDREAIDALFTATWGEPIVVGHGVRYDLRTLPTLVTDGVTGVLTYQIDGDSLEVVSIEAAEPGNGVGTALLHAAAAVGRESGLRRLWLITTN